MANEKLRWVAVVGYRTMNGLLLVEHQVDEIEELHQLLEDGPSFAAIDKIEIRYQLGDGKLTVEQVSEK